MDPSLLCKMMISRGYVLMFDDCSGFTLPSPEDNFYGPQGSIVYKIQKMYSARTNDLFISKKLSLQYFVRDPFCTDCVHD